MHENPTDEARVARAQSVVPDNGAGLFVSSGGAGRSSKITVAKGPIARESRNQAIGERRLDAAMFALITANRTHNHPYSAMNANIAATAHAFSNWYAQQIAPDCRYSARPSGLMVRS